MASVAVVSLWLDFSVIFLPKSISSIDGRICREGNVVSRVKLLSRHSDRRQDDRHPSCPLPHQSRQR